ncbi:YwqG family protein [Isobaculum melis]|uniref:Uncharacterized protein YwqG n=1 Tax=Isobaculum melis TaxID=142588 RepID=A0A1H9TSR2_9LACT|nr:YwqG family protein [Isobaculum melis]SES00084.1 Uncharacterized protein YwqG [Isobaculum melis]
MEKLKKLYQDYELGSYFDKIKSHAKNAIHIEMMEVEENNIEIGASKIGGLPDLPKDVDWFNNEETKNPMAFIAQLNFAELKPFDTADKLPEKGILYLFYDCSEDAMSWGYDPKDVVGRKIFFYEGSLDTLERKNLAEDSLFEVAKLSFYTQMELPDYTSSLVSKQSLSADGYDDYWRLKEEVMDDVENKVLGHSNNIQDGMELECELVTNGLYCGDSSGYNSPEREKLEKNITNWTLLLQIDSNEELGMFWGDSGKLYLWITEENLKNKQFDDSWLILQCY